MGLYLLVGNVVGLDLDVHTVPFSQGQTNIQLSGGLISG